MSDAEASSFLFDATGIRENKFHARVDFENTDYSVTIACDDSSQRGFSALARVMQWIAGLLTPLAFDEKILQEEVAVMLSDVEQERDHGSAAQTAQATRLALDGTPFAARLLRGNAGDVANATIDKVLAFQQRLYHTHNAAVIVCGDFKKYTIALDIINKHLAPLHAGAAGKARVVTPLPVSEMKLARGPLYGFSRSEETKSEHSRVLIEFRVAQGADGDHNNSMGFLQAALADEVLRGFLKARVTAIAAKLGLQDPVVNDKAIGSALLLVEVAFTAAAGKEIAAFSRVVEEIERMHRFGGLVSELELYQSLAFSTLRQMVAVNLSASDQLVSSLIDRVKAGLSPVHTSPRTLVSLLESLENKHLIAAAKRLSFENAAIFVSLAAGATATDVEFNAALEKVTKSSEITAAPTDIEAGGVCVSLSRPLPDPGSIVQQDHPDETVHQYELSNGMFVLVAVLPSDPEEDPAEADGQPQVSVTLSTNGGYGEVFVNEKEKFASAIIAGVLASSLGLGSIDLSSIPFSGGVSPPILSSLLFERSLNAGALSADFLESLFTTLHDIFTSETSQWSAWTDAAIARELALLREDLRDPLSAEHILEQKMRDVNWGSNPLIKTITESDIDTFDVAWARKYLRSMFQQPALWKMQLAVRVTPPSDGDGDDGGAFLEEHVKEIEDLLVKYIASIPAPASPTPEESLEVFRGSVMTIADQIRFQRGVKVSEVFVPEGEADRAMLRISVPLDNLTNSLEVAAVDFICLLLEAHFFELMRDTTAGNVDSVSVSPQFPFSAIFPGELNITFTCEPQTVDSLLQMCLASIKKLAESGPSKQQITQSKQLLLNSPSQLSGIAESLSPEGTTLFGSETRTTDITKVMTVERAKELIRYMLHLKSYTAVKLFSQKLEDKRKAGKPLILDEEDEESEPESSEEDSEDSEAVPNASKKTQQASAKRAATQKRGSGSGSSTALVGVVAIGFVAALLGTAGFFYFRNRKARD